MVSHRLVIEMIHRSRLRHNLVKWLVAYLRGRKDSCRYHQQLYSPPRQVRAGVPQGSVISPALSNHLVLDCLIHDLDMTSYADDFPLLSSTPSIVEAEAKANELCSSLVRWTDGMQLTIVPPKYSVTLFTSDNHQSQLHRQMRIDDAVAPLNRTPKILVITLDTYFTFGPRSRPQLCRAGFTTKTLVATL